MDIMWKVSKAESKKVSQALNLKRQRMFIVDSGASFHMASRKSLTVSERKTIKDTAPIPINTADGIIYVKKEVKVYVHELGIHVWAYILESDVALLSLGLLCSEGGGWSYNWEPGQLPTLTKGKKVVIFPTSHNAPTICTSSSKSSNDPGGDPCATKQSKETQERELMKQLNEIAGPDLSEDEDEDDEVGWEEVVDKKKNKNNTPPPVPSVPSSHSTPRRTGKPRSLG